MTWVGALSRRCARVAGGSCQNHPDGDMDHDQRDDTCNETSRLEIHKEPIVWSSGRSSNKLSTTSPILRRPNSS